MKKSVVWLLVLLFAASGVWTLWRYIAKQNADGVSNSRVLPRQDALPEHSPQPEPETASQRLEARVAEALAYVQAHGLDREHAIFVDFKQHSGRPRFFVWNFSSQQVEMESLVAHGYGTERYRSTSSQVVFSNEMGSHASSLGKYRTGARSVSRFGIGIHYKLHGLEETNNNAFKRVVVLHSSDYLPGWDIYPFHLPLGFSQGCPVIDNASMEKIDALLKRKNAPVLLWIYA